MIDWNSDATTLHLNPRLPIQDQISLEDLPKLPGHVWVTTSGTTSLKFVALSKEALLCSAEAVNKHLNTTQEDVWIHPLPTFHVGGIGIFARAHLGGQRVIIHEKWDPQQFVEQCKEASATLTALVPTQVYDLVRSQLKAPPSLRVAVVGGGKLSPELLTKAIALGWPLALSYGMTECCSQVATALPGSNELLLLSHVKVKTDNNSIAISSPSLLTGYFYRGKFIDPKVEGWFQSEDRGEIHGDSLEVKGRDRDFVKIGGESVDLCRLNHLLDDVKIELDLTCNDYISTVPDERLGCVITLVSESSYSEVLTEIFNSLVSPYERIRHTQVVSSVKKTPLGKIMY